MIGGQEEGVTAKQEIFAFLHGPADCQAFTFYGGISALSGECESAARKYQVPALWTASGCQVLAIAVFLKQPTAEASL